MRNQALDVLQYDVWACFGYLTPLMVPNLISMLGDKESSYEQVTQRWRPVVSAPAFRPPPMPYALNPCPFFHR